MTAIRPTAPERIGAAALTAALVGLLGYAFLAGLTIGLPAAAGDALKTFVILPSPPPPPPEKIAPHAVRSKRPEGAAAPPNLKSRPTDIVAPPPIIRIVTPPPVVVAPVAGNGGDASAGNAAIPGPGPGSGGIGHGTGSGDRGNGDGGGGFTAPRQTKGRLKDSDYPRAAAEAGAGGTVSVRFVVLTNGRVTDCEITHSSGNDALDDTTCRLIEQRFRFDPSRDPDGRPVESMVVENHSWEIDRGIAPP